MFFSFVDDVKHLKKIERDVQLLVRHKKQFLDGVTQILKHLFKWGDTNFKAFGGTKSSQFHKTASERKIPFIDSFVAEIKTIVIKIMKTFNKTNYKT